MHSIKVLRSSADSPWDTFSDKNGERNKAEYTAGGPNPSVCNRLGSVGVIGHAAGKTRGTLKSVGHFVNDVNYPEYRGLQAI